MHEICKRYTFEAAHMLEGHKGKCARLHGHSYKVDVAIRGHHLVAEGSSEGMIVDFDEIDTAMIPIIAFFDHRFLAEGHEQLAAFVDPHHIAEIGVRTTAENIATWIAREVQHGVGVQLDFVRVWETEKAYAQYNTPR